MYKVENVCSMCHKIKGVLKMLHRNSPEAYMKGTTNNFPSGTNLIMDSANNRNIIYSIGLS